VFGEKVSLITTFKKSTHLSRQKTAATGLKFQVKKGRKGRKSKF
jgi:hypothetical protein